MPMDTCSLVQEFLVFLDAERGCSPLTLSAYASDLSQFWSFAQENGVTSPDGVTTPLVRAWLAHLKRNGLAYSSIARHASALRSFWRYLLDNAHVAHDPLRPISTPKRKQTVPTSLSVDEVRLLMDAAHAHRDPVVATRDSAMICTLVFTGLRRGELLALTVDDLNLDTRTLHVRNGKGGKDRLIPVSEEVVEPVREWLSVRPTGKTDALFTTTCGNRVHSTRMQIIWKRVLRDSGITRPGVSLHTLRHTFATLLLHNGADLVTIQRLLGHTRLDTTAVYLHTNTDDLREGMSCHPLALAQRNTEEAPRQAAVVKGDCSRATGWRVRA